MIPSARIVVVPGPCIGMPAVRRALELAPADYDIRELDAAAVAELDEHDCDVVVLGVPLRAVRSQLDQWDEHTAVVAVLEGSSPRERREALELGADELCPVSAVGEGGLHIALQSALVRQRMEVRLRRHTRRQTQLLELTRALARQSDTAAVHRCLIEHIEGYAGAAGGGLWVISEDRQWMRLVESVGARASSTAAAQRLPASAPTMAAACMRAGEFMVAPERAELERDHPFLVQLEPASRAAMASPLHDSNGRVAAIIGLRFEVDLDEDHVGYLRLFGEIGTDATRRSDLFERLQERSQFEERLLSMVGHDLRNPLNTLSMGLDLLESTDPEHLDGQTVGRLRRASTQIHTVAGDLFDLTHARRGQLAVERRSVRVGELVRDLLGDIRTQHPTFHFEAHLEDPELELAIDGPRITQALGNLLTNAVRYGAPDRPVRILVGADGDQATIRVHNWGTVIAAERLRSLFEPFARGGAPHVPFSLGLGLYIVREIARAHGGDATAASSEDGGTAFTLRLPLAS